MINYGPLELNELTVSTLIKDERWSDEVQSDTLLLYIEDGVRRIPLLQKRTLDSRF